MKFIPHASSSKANFYELRCGSSALAIEAGLRFRQMQRAMGFHLSKLSGLLLTHCHQDHSRGVTLTATAGVEIYASGETLKAVGLWGHHRANFAIAGHHLDIGPWRVLPFEVIHDVPCMGFLVQAPDGDQLLFGTDTAYLPVTGDGFTHLALECSWSDETLLGGDQHPAHTARMIGSHMSVEVLIEALLANDRALLTRCREIHLLHVSDSLGDEAGFKERIQKATGVSVYVAPKGIQ